MAWTPPPTRIEPTPRRVRVRLGDKVIADSSRALLLIRYPPAGLPTSFVPLEDVRPGALPDETAGGWSVVAGGRRAAGAAAVDEEFPELKGYGTFSWETLDWYEEDEPVLVH